MGFDNGTISSGVFAQAKQSGGILRGSGPPVPQAGVDGDVYIDVLTWFLYQKRGHGITDPWGHYLFQVPAAYQNNLAWFSTSLPTDDIGIAGDYCLLWSGYPNYGLTKPLICGPKVSSGWAENANGVLTQLDPSFAGYVLPVGLVGEGTAVAFSASTQMIVEGLTSEYCLSIPIANVGNTPVLELGLAALPVQIAVALNPLYTAQDSNGV